MDNNMSHLWTHRSFLLVPNVPDERLMNIDKEMEFFFAQRFQGSGYLFHGCQKHVSWQVKDKWFTGFSNLWIKRWAETQGTVIILREQACDSKSLRKWIAGKKRQERVWSPLEKEMVVILKEWIFRKRDLNYPGSAIFCLLFLFSEPVIGLKRKDKIL